MTGSLPPEQTAGAAPAVEYNLDTTRDLAADRELVRSLLRDVPDFPAPGVVFKDIAGIISDGAGLRAATNALAAIIEPFGQIDLVAGMEARGFIFGAPLAARLGAGFIPVRKAGKLPPPVLHASYQLEYGTAELEVREGTIPEGARVLILDDVLATGGTAAAGVDLLKRAGADVVGMTFLLEVPELGGRNRLPALPLAVLLP